MSVGIVDYMNNLGMSQSLALWKFLHAHMHTCVHTQLGNCIGNLFVLKHRLQWIQTFGSGISSVFLLFIHICP